MHRNSSAPSRKTTSPLARLWNSYEDFISYIFLKRPYIGFGTIIVLIVGTLLLYGNMPLTMSDFAFLLLVLPGIIGQLIGCLAPTKTIGDHGTSAGGDEQS